MTLKIIKIDGKEYTLVDSDGKKYQLTLRFFDLEEQLSPGDMIKFHPDLLDKNYVEYSTSYIFGGLDKPYGRKITSKDNVDCIAIKTIEKVIYLKRFFG